jgi:hypothetical protein
LIAGLMIAGFVVRAHTFCLSVFHFVSCSRFLCLLATHPTP